MSSPSTSLLRFVTATAIGLTIAGCRAEPAQPAGFVDHAVMTRDPTLPFQKIWMEPGLNFAHYSKMYVAPVDTAHMLAETDWQKGDRKDQFASDVAKLAGYTRDAVRKSFRDDVTHHFIVLDSPPHDSDALIFNIALIEVVPSKVVLNALDYAPFFIGLGISAVRAVAKDQSTVAFEARMVDAGTRQTVVMIADREAEQAAIVTIRGLTWYSHAQSIISQWSSQFVRMTNRKPGEKIKPTDAFTLQPW